MAKNPLSQMMAQAVTPGPVQGVPPGKLGAKPKSVPVPKGVQKTASLGPLPASQRRRRSRLEKASAARPAPKPFGKSRSEVHDRQLALAPLAEELSSAGLRSACFQ